MDLSKIDKPFRPANQDRGGGMTLRERIADWISGGKLSAMYWSKQCWIDIVYSRERELKVLEEALNEIISQEKPTSNSTVKRMARIAKEALNG